MAENVEAQRGYHSLSSLKQVNLETVYNLLEEGELKWKETPSLDREMLRTTSMDQGPGPGLGDGTVSGVWRGDETRDWKGFKFAKI